MENSSPAAGTSPTAIRTASATDRPKPATAAFLTLLVVLVVVGGAWFLGQRAGFGAIGTGGANLRLLPRIGESAPDIELFSLTDGRRVRLSDYRGQPIWLNFWGSWCPPCRSEFPELQAAYVDILAPHGVVFLAISLDEPPEAAARYAARNGGTFTILSDPDRRDTGSVYPIANFPTHILIDREGDIRDIILSPMDQAMITEAAEAIITPEPRP